MAHAREVLAGYKRPKYVVLVDALPKNPSGKILKRELRQPARGHRAPRGVTSRAVASYCWHLLGLRVVRAAGAVGDRP